MSKHRSDVPVDEVLVETPQAVSLTDYHEFVRSSIFSSPAGELLDNKD